MTAHRRGGVTGPDGTVVSTAPVQVPGPTVNQPLDRNLPPGTYTVLWRVPAADGGPSSGRFTFTGDLLRQA